MIIGVLAGLGLGAAAGAAPVDLTNATSGYSFFNRPGATMKDLRVEMSECLRFATATGQPSYGGVAMEALVHDAVDDTQGPLAANLENCMVARGWRVVLLPPDQGLRLFGLGPSGLARELAVRVGQAAPEGRIARRWGNDAARLDTIRFVRADGPTEMSLSRTAIPGMDAPVSMFPLEKDVFPDNAKPPAPLTGKALASVSPGSALLIVRVRSTLKVKSSSLTFERVAAKPMALARSEDRLTDVVRAPITSWGDTQADKTYAFAVPPGRWRIRDITEKELPLNFCLGSPSFEVKAGEVVFAGSFDITSEKFDVDAALDPARTVLKTQPALAARLRPAAWSNGAVGPCGGSYIYALEFPGAPYLDGYRWGGAAKAN